MYRKLSDILNEQNEEAVSEGTEGCSDCEYMKSETDGEIDTCDECAADEREKTNEAGGYYTKPVYDMIEQHGIEKVMHELLTALDADVIKDALGRMISGMEESVVDEAEVEEDNAFNSAAANAKNAGESHFTFNGKKYKVKMDADTASSLSESIQRYKTLAGI